jgi:eukaryotic-like serine/threonine-protein kinase
MTQLREHWEGVSLPGDYLLERWTSGDDTAGYFEASCALDGRRAAVKLVSESAVDTGAQLVLWERTRRLQHPNLRALLDCGRAELAGEVVLYAVFEYADESLASALSQSPLSETEAREVLEAAAGALDYLKSQGLAHFELDPEHVVAVGDQIKLSTDALGEAVGGTENREELRTFWFKISPCTVARSSDILALVLGAVPRLGQAADPAAPDEIPPKPEAVMRPVAPEPAPLAPLAADVTPPPTNRFPKWIPVGAVGVVVLILALHFRSAPDVPAQTAPAPMVSAPLPRANTPEVGASTPVPKVVSKPARVASKPAPASTGMWRVIAFTFRTRAAAVKKVEQINQRHPRLEATVFSPKEKQGYYLVALGGRMTREEALRMEKKARAEHLSRDVYVQNYLE